MSCYCILAARQIFILTTYSGRRVKVLKTRYKTFYIVVKNKYMQKYGIKEVAKSCYTLDSDQIS